MKKGPLSQKEKEYITKNFSGFTGKIDELADKMSRSKSIVQKFIDTLEEELTKTTNASSLYAGNKERGVTVMTESASMAADESKADKTSETPARYRQFIHKIKENE
tara:strand:- start:341 stop:658 length:318 start_codon:yes stop_codon:yes gene_type:complete